jgi:hypothetical protein
MKESFQSQTGAKKAALIGAVAVIVGVFLPWVSVLGLSVSGISTGDGKIVLIVAAGSLVLMAAAYGVVSWFDISQRLANIVSMAAGALCLIVSIADLNDFAAIGLYLTLVASLVWTVAAAMTLFKRKALRSNPDADLID